jgi:hypothetical protein
MNLMIKCLLIHFLFAIASCNVKASDWLTEQNCVDSSIVNFLHSHKTLIDKVDYETSLLNLGFDKNASTRSLADALKILDSFGLECVALFNSETPSHLKDKSIAFFTVPKSGSHCVYIEKQQESIIVWDPRPVQIDERDWRGVDVQIFIVSRSAYLSAKAFEFLKLLLLGSITGLAAFTIYRVLQSVQKKRMQLVELLVLFMAFSTFGCEHSERDIETNADSRPVVHDLGGVSGIVVVDKVRFQFPDNRKFKSIRKSCGCLSIDFDFTDFVSERNRQYEIPLRIDISNRTGPFSEQFQIDWIGSPSPQTFVVRGFVVKPPIITPSPLVLTLDSSGRLASGNFEAILSHSFANHPKLIRIEFDRAESMNVPTMQLKEAYSRETWTQPGLGVVQNSYDISADFASPVHEVPLEELNCVIRWSESSLDMPISMRLEKYIAVQFATENYWLNFRHNTSVIDSVPLIIADSQIEKDRISVRFSDNQLSGTFEAMDSGLIRVSCPPDRQDSFTSICELLVDGLVVDSIEILVN